MKEMNRNTSEYFVQHRIVCSSNQTRCCGGGSGFWSALELKAESTVIVVPSLYLISQSIRVWSREILANHIDAEFLVVCSDFGCPCGVHFALILASQKTMQNGVPKSRILGSHVRCTGGELRERRASRA